MLASGKCYILEDQRSDRQCRRNSYGCGHIIRPGGLLPSFSFQLNASYFYLLLCLSLYIICLFHILYYSFTLIPRTQLTRRDCIISRLPLLVLCIKDYLYYFLFSLFIIIHRTYSGIVKRFSHLP